ncbi:extracellular solute-binding protein [Solirhodobacter olei]|uniref:extracellular solute-binding protein n=1 Tax=Solirhodobacter olei TaxID=2493082 RepID=UPI001F4E37C8|nr:extracellular solute-binding protein [Solirhodobacter olei]
MDGHRALRPDVDQPGGETAGPDGIERGGPHLCQATNPSDAGPARGDRLGETHRVVARSAAGTGRRNAAAGLRSGTKVTTAGGIETGADVAAAEKEGEVVFYTHDSGAAAAAICEAFQKDFPKIKARYVSAQNGNLYSKILAERQAGRHEADAIQFSDLGTAIDFQKKGGYEMYRSPQEKYYSTDHLSDPPGYFFWIAMGFCGLAYNTDRVKAADAPKRWKDVLDPKYKGMVSCKQANSGMQFTEWYELRKLYGDSFWKAFSKQKPHAVNSRVQLFDRLASGDDGICAMAEWAGYALAQQKKAPIKFVAPPDGVPASPMLNGIVSKAPHPQAARLSHDWQMSIKGQKLIQENPFLYYGSVHKEAPPMPGGYRLSDFKLLVPTNMTAFLGSRKQFNSEWNQMLGLL